MFKTNSQLKDELATAQSKIESLESDATESAEKIESLTNELATAREDLKSATEATETLTTERDEARGEVERLKLDLEEANKATEAADKSAGAKAAAEIAAAGHPPLVVDPGADGQTSSTPHLDKFESLNGAAGTAYFKKHREAIRAEMRSR